MKKFVFRLESLLRYREHLEEQARMAAGKAQADVNESRAEIERSRKSLETSRGAMFGEVEVGVEGSRFLAYTSLLSGIESDMSKERSHLESLKEVLKKRQQELSEKRVDKRAMENLKTARQDEYYDRMRKTEQKEADDLVLIRKAGGHTT